jgi:type II secretory pathway component GspD/PulD (secretin)
MRTVGAAALSAILAIPAWPALSVTEAPASAKTPVRGRGPAVAGVRAARFPLAPGDRISLDLKDADIRDVLRTFASLARLNLVVDPEVRGSVTVRLHDVRWEDALEVILRSNGLASEREEKIVRVGTTARLLEEAPQ